jgi:transcriptional regulator with XRE-family HTH domain
MDSQRYIRAFGEAVRQSRKAMKMSQEQFAEASGLHRTFIGQIEQAKKKITIETLVKVANGFAIKPSDLLKVAEKLYTESPSKQ